MKVVGCEKVHGTYVLFDEAFTYALRISPTSYCKRSQIGYPRFLNLLSPPTRVPFSLSPLSSSFP